MKAFIYIIIFITLSITPPSAFGADTAQTSDVVSTAISKNGAFVSDTLEARATNLFRDIKCPICVAQSVAESDAEISKSLREHIRREIVAGKTDKDILEDLTVRYGTSILLNPPVKAATLLLWTAPWLFLLVSAFIWRHAHRRPQRTPAAS